MRSSASRRTARSPSCSTPRSPDPPPTSATGDRATSCLGGRRRRSSQGTADVMSKRHTIDTLDPRAARRDRHRQLARAARAGKIPGVVYGHGELDRDHDRREAVRRPPALRQPQPLLDATSAGRSDSVLLRHIDSDPITRQPLSVDFQRVSKDEAITAIVTVVTERHAGRRARSGRRDGRRSLHALEIKGPAHPSCPTSSRSTSTSSACTST